jgi:hypothetical protein
MDYLKVDHLGGMYLEAEDWIFNQNGIKQALKGLTSVAGNNFILSGVKPLSITPTLIAHQEGYVVLEGEIFYVPVHIFSATGNFIYIEVNEWFDPNGLEVFEDGGTPKNTYIKRTAKIARYNTAQAITPNRKDFNSLLTFAEAIADNSELQLRLGSYIYQTHAPSYLTAFSGNLFVGKNRLNQIKFFGNITRSNILSADAFQLPQDFRPGQIITFSVTEGELVGSEVVPVDGANCNIMIRPNGIVSVHGLQGGRYAMLGSINY